MEYRISTMDCSNMWKRSQIIFKRTDERLDILGSMSDSCGGWSKTHHWNGPFEKSWAGSGSTTSKKGKCVNNFDYSTCKLIQAITSQFPDLVFRVGSSTTQVAKSKFLQKFTAMHQKSRLVSFNLQLTVFAELDQLQKEGYIEKSSSCSNKNIFPTVTV